MTEKGMSPEEAQALLGEFENKKGMSADEAKEYLNVPNLYTSLNKPKSAQPDAMEGFIPNFPIYSSLGRKAAAAPKISRSFCSPTSCISGGL